MHLLSQLSLLSLFMLSFCCCCRKDVVSAEIIELTTEEFHDMHFGGGSGSGSQFDLVIDVRTLSEFNEGHVENATLVHSFGYLLRDINETLKSIGITPCLHSCATASKLF